MIIDAHHHLWKFSEEEYGWIGSSMQVLKRDYLPGDLREEMTGAGVEGTVVIQARQKFEETRWLLELAAGNPFIRGVVGWVDLCSEPASEQLQELADDPKGVGVRHVLQDEPDDDFMLRPAFLQGIELLGRYDLAYDLLIFPRHLSNAAELVSRFPEQRFVLDHLAKPLIRDGVMEPWKRDLEILAANQNVWCKVSGMVTEADLVNWKYIDFIPYLDVVLAAFGPERLMLGSDWPVCRLAGEYKEILDIPVSYFSKHETIDRQKISRDNCINFYRLPDL